MNVLKEMLRRAVKEARLRIDVRIMQYYGVKILLRLGHLQWEKFEVIAATGCPERLIDTLLSWLRNDLDLIETRIDVERLSCLGNDMSALLCEAFHAESFVRELPEMYLYRLVNRAPGPRRRTQADVRRYFEPSPVRAN